MRKSLVWLLRLSPEQPEDKYDREGNNKKWGDEYQKILHMIPS